MATEVDDYRPVARFLEQIRRQVCFAPQPGAPPELVDDIPYLGLSVLTGGCVSLQAMQNSDSLHVFTSGLTEVEAVLTFAPEPEFDADLRAVVAATNERALRDVLLAFPRGQLGFFYVGGDWPLRAMSEILDGHAMPAREGYVATSETFSPDRTHDVRRLNRADYAAVREHWSEAVWEEVMDLGYAVFVCQEERELRAFCFHWEVTPTRREVHGLQGVTDFSARHAESVVSAATEDVLRSGRIATCTANLSSHEEYVRSFRNVGYRRFYRVDSFLGLKRGSGRFVGPPLDVFYQGRASVQPRRTGLEAPGEGRPVTRSDPLVARFRDLIHVLGRRERSQFVVEGQTLVTRAIADGLPVDSLVYTVELLRSTEGLALLELARRAGIDHHRASGGLMGTLTATRPLPAVIAAVNVLLRDAAELWTTPATALLVAENLQNPDNLGMVLRAADAAGIEAVVVAGGEADPLHRSCVRAARGAVGRLPIFISGDAAAWLEDQRGRGLFVVGATSRGDVSLFQHAFRPPVAIVVGNEHSGISRSVLDVCSERIRIPMAPGQDSLNVAVASGVLLYELARQRSRLPP